MVESLEPLELARRLARGDDLVLLDVRTDRELAVCRLPNALHVPLHELEDRIDELDPTRHVVCICHHGIRSAGAAAFLESLAFRAVSNLDGGIDAWARTVDPAMRRY
jgi:rhodanese-related sulfurtransferase